MPALSQKQLEVLEALEEEGRLTAYALGKKLGIGNTAASSRCSPLLEKGYIEKEEITAEGEVVKRYYKITDKGRSAAVNQLEAALGSFRDLDDLLDGAEAEEKSAMEQAAEEAN